MNEIGYRLWALRKGRGKSQKEIADLLGLTPAAYGKIENGDRGLDVAYCVRLAEYFGTTCDYILSGISSDPNKGLNRAKEEAGTAEDGTDLRIGFCANGVEWEVSIKGSDMQAQASKNKENTSAAPKWISTEDRVPDVGDVVLVLASGKPRENIELHNAYLIASYWESEGWIADGYEEWESVEVSYWMPLPDEPWKRETQDV